MPTIRGELWKCSTWARNPTKSYNSFEGGSPDRLECKGAKGAYWQAQGEVSEVRGELGDGDRSNCFLESRVFSSAGSTLKLPNAAKPHSLARALASSLSETIQAP